MKYLIRSARITDSRSPMNGKKMDILIEGGEITQIRNHISTDEKVKVIQSENLFVSPGWLDMQANFCDPGNEVKEDIDSGLKAAAAGGFTGVCLSPATQPPISSKTQIEYVLSKARGNAVDVFPMGTATHQMAGEDIAEMYDMKLAGAVAFGDDKKPLKDAGLLMRCLQYSSNIDSLLVAHCDERSLSKGGLMNEGAQSTAMGVKGIPGIAEELMLERNLSMLRYTGGRLHIPLVSTKRSVELIKNAKTQGLLVTAGVASINLLLDDVALEGFDSNLKLNPPLRSREDVEALRKAVNSGVIDVVVSDHSPEDVENKELEFDYAAFGAIGLETAYASLQTSINKLEPEQIVNCLSIRPRSILRLPAVEIKEGSKANLTLFDPSIEWTFQKQHIHSKSSNTALIGRSFKGKVIGIINKNQAILLS
jgi:dihydroorotase